MQNSNTFISANSSQEFWGKYVNTTHYENQAFSAMPWMFFGRNNTYPQELLNYYYVPTHKACLDLKIRMTAGEGLVVEPIDDTIPLSEEHIAWIESNLTPDFLWQSITDMVVLNAMSWQCSWSACGTRVVQIKHQPVATVRFSRLNEYSNISCFYVCRDWFQWTLPHFNPTKMEIWDPLAGDKGVQLKYWAAYNPDYYLYPNPTYAGALHAIESEFRTTEHLVRISASGFTPSAFMRIPPVAGGAESEEAIALTRQVQAYMVGVENAQKLIPVQAVGDDNGTPLYPEVVPFESANHTDMPKSVGEQSRQLIVTANDIPSPMLVGIPGPAGLGNNDELINSQEMLQKGVIARYQKNLCIELQKILSINCIPAKLSITPSRPIGQRAIPAGYDKILTINELREMSGFCPIEGGDRLSSELPTSAQMDASGPAYSGNVMGQKFGKTKSRPFTITIANSSEFSSDVMNRFKTPQTED